MSASYGRAVRKADDAVAEVLQAADDAFGRGQYTVILTSDHGGHGRTHGTADARDVTIPWIVWGAGVRAGGVLPAGVRTMDTAATALWLLGVAQVEPAVGVPVRAAFAGSATSAAGF
jgi:arylsulfatase A-like enzyme